MQAIARNPMATPQASPFTPSCKGGSVRGSVPWYVLVWACDNLQAQRSSEDR